MNDERTPLIVTVHERRRARSSFFNNMYWTIGCLYGLTSVAMGAFGAHGLKRRLNDPAKLANWGTAAQYQLIHSGVLLLTAAVAPKNKTAAFCFTAGMTMFSGSIYLLVLDSQRFKFLGPVTPIGGMFLILGWAALAFGSRNRFIQAD